MVIDHQSRCTLQDNGARQFILEMSPSKSRRMLILGVHIKHPRISNKYNQGLVYELWGVLSTVDRRGGPAVDDPGTSPDIGRALL
jgi:hypothetical protein